MLKKNFTRLIALGVLLAPLWCAVGQSSAGPEAVLKERGRYADILYVHTDSALRSTIPVYVTGVIR
jgi:hypothetical protein